MAQQLRNPTSIHEGVPIMAQQLRNPTSIHEDTSLSGLRIQSCLELRCRSQTWLRSYLAVAMV